VIVVKFLLKGPSLLLYQGGLIMFEDKHKELKRRMRRLKIFEKDIKEDFVRASGPGGQNVNKVSSCVMLHHVPTGILVKCQKEREQALNRYQARFLLVKKIEHQRKMDLLEEQQRLAKIKRQTRKRPKGLKESILKDKKQQSEKKATRRKITVDSIDE